MEGGTTSSPSRNKCDKPGIPAHYQTQKILIKVKARGHRAPQGHKRVILQEEAQKSTRLGNHYNGTPNKEISPKAGRETPWAQRPRQPAYD